VISYAAQLRQELCTRNSVYAVLHKLPHVCSYGETPVTVYEPSSDGYRHGNFLNASYAAILKRPEWKRRLDKIHAQAARSLPRAERLWRELDSCMSSDALLMNVFCHPLVLRTREVRSLLGIDDDELPTFGFPARVPLRRGCMDRTEVDMKLDSLLVESKLTETDFQIKAADIVELYRDLDEVFERRNLPRAGERYVSYQLIRNVLAAHALGFSFCVLIDSRRPDLQEAWYGVVKCIKSPELKIRCKVLTWQELSEALPLDLQKFLDRKYGIVSPGSVPSRVDQLKS
jgi:hypothetical protein